ncbi:hypothetical protein I4U23_003487 [Adineta vaga]|nr:hypothetical protein I4U23_003487 [Adineta vaga]
MNIERQMPIDAVGMELNDLSSAMVAQVQKPDSTAVTVYNINLHFMNKCQERILKYGQLQGLLTEHRQQEQRQ